MDFEGGVDAFLTKEARIGYDIFGLYLVDMGRLFEIEWSAKDKLMFRARNQNLSA